MFDISSMASINVSYNNFQEIKEIFDWRKYNCPVQANHNLRNLICFSEIEQCLKNLCSKFKKQAEKNVGDFASWDLSWIKIPM